MDIKSLLSDAPSLVGGTVAVNGWVRTLRASKNIGFIELNDGTCFNNLQVVFGDDKIDNFDAVSKVSVGTSIAVEGILTESAGAGQLFEINAWAVEIIGECLPEYPLQKKRHSFEYLRTIAHLRPRTNTFSAVFRIRSLAAFAVHKFFQERRFVYVNTPIITANDCEGAGEMFRVTTLDDGDAHRTKDGSVDFSDDFFGRQTNLTVSGQLEGEAFAMAFKRIYTFGPTFRAENSNTPRHAAEFWMIEPEIAFADLNDDMELAEDMVKYIIRYCLQNAREEMEFFNKFIDNGLLARLDSIVNSDFEHITYTEALRLLKKNEQQFTFPVAWGSDLQTEHERYITEKIFEKPVFVTDYPKEIKAFYMRLNDDDRTVAAMDLLVPGVGEMIGGSQREERLSVLEKRMDSIGLNKAPFWWYFDLRKYGGVKHAGFGLGFERAIMYLTGMGNIRDVIPFPRTPKSVDF